jgi:hypothetical protein
MDVNTGPLFNCLGEAYNLALCQNTRSGLWFWWFYPRSPGARLRRLLLHLRSPLKEWKQFPPSTN